MSKWKGIQYEFIVTRAGIVIIMWILDFNNKYLLNQTRTVRWQKNKPLLPRPVTRTQQPGGAMIFLGGAITYNKFSYGQLKYKLEI